MTASKSLPARPSLESLRKQAKKLARDRSLSLRDAQFALAREYGYAGWQDLTAEVRKRLGRGLEWAAMQARQIIHDNDIERLKQLLAEYPALLSWQGRDGDSKSGLLGFATGAYGDAGDAQREQWFTRGACAEFLIDAGAVVAPPVCEGILHSRARGLLALFQRKDLLPRTLKFRAALGDIDAVRTAVDGLGSDLPTINEAFVCASRFEHEAVASLLLDRSIALDPELGTHIDGSTDRVSFMKSFEKGDRAHVAELGLWKVFVMDQVRRTVTDRDLTALVGCLQRDPWLLGDAFVAFQAELIATASYQNDPAQLIGALLDLDPAILRHQPPPPSKAIEWAFVYANTHLLPLLTSVWPVPDDLAHAAGMGNLAQVKRWFEGPLTPQHVLDTAFAWSVINRQYEVADFLLEHGANINTNWNSHEPASILHHLVFLPDPYEPMQFLIDRGIDLTIKDYRWDATALGWARVALKDEKMAQWLEEAERQRN